VSTSDATSQGTSQYRNTTHSDECLPSSLRLDYVTGPQVDQRRGVSEQDRCNLKLAYELSLDAAVAHGLKTVAFPCISTGLFGFPTDKAVDIALSSVQAWLEEHPNQLERVIFDVFTKEDATLYNDRVGVFFPLV
jgi:O-acetyl-ADP-ribose deacetylase (regulator of RNase III)